MRIAQITDLHIGEVDERPFDVDVRSNFQSVLSVLKKLHIEHLVISGDLCLRHGEAHIYRWIKSELAKTAISYDLIPGNHDDPKLLARIFDCENKMHKQELFFAKYLHHIPTFFLDTTHGVLSLQQRKWLQSQLQEIDSQAIVFMHHPPIFGSVPYMDQHYPLQNRDEVQAIFFTHPYPIQVFCGHYHVGKTIHQKNISVHITPSTYFQINPFQEAFAVDSVFPGFRIIEINDDLISHSVRYHDAGSKKSD